MIANNHFQAKAAVNALELRHLLDGKKGARGLAQSHRGGQGIALRSDVIGRDVMPLGVEKKESELVLAGDANIGFVAGSGVAEGGFVAEVEGVAVISGGLGIVEDGLVAEGHAEDSPEDLRSLAGGEGKKEMWKASTKPNTSEEHADG